MEVIRVLLLLQFCLSKLRQYMKTCHDVFISSTIQIVQGDGAIRFRGRT